MSYAIVRTDAMEGTVEAKDLVSLKYGVEIENGNVLVIGDIEDGEREVRSATAPTASSELSTIALVASEEVVKDKTYNGLGDFINGADDIIRGYRLIAHDIFSVTIEALDGVSDISEISVGDTVNLQDGTKLAINGAGTLVGSVIKVEESGGCEWVVIQVVA